ncbi:ABC transporter ATP-binding protein [Leucobacter sp. wl10]|uniref:ABC transporter ATP-binding protein n=1 Tax=Leucobacter sp. wl10 TaxID=2304677 RepID=UPI000E5A56BB|nr:ATP-binding cassette domain-containing protein [Leucobacter sp. wl10]RGE21524.1 ABC transporter ATP-binding protein [Leucobacter sp. wl10]
MADSENSEPILQVSNLSIRHPDRSRATPSAVSFEARRGEVILILGPSGSGKSSLAMALAGIIPQYVAAELTGDIRVAGLETGTVPVPQLATVVASVFQDADAQLIAETALDEVSFAPENFLLDPIEIADRAEEALTLVGLWDHRDRDPETFSGGERQRLAIAAAFAQDPALLVLDEPTANLDSVAAESVYDALAARLARSDPPAVVVVEHSLDHVVGLATRVMVMDGAGAVRFDGTPREVLGDRAAEVAALGVWLPTATSVALRVAAAGHPVAEVPLDAVALARHLDTVAEPLPVRPAARAVGRAETVMEVRSLRVERQGATLVRDASFRIARGSVVAVVGRSGAGKSSLLAALAGVVPPPRGTVTLHAGDRRLDIGTARVREIVQHVGFVFQNPEHQFIEHSVTEELAFGLRRFADIPPGVEAETWVSAEVERMLARFDLTDLASAHPFMLSGGQKRRLSVGTALAADPGVLVLDEPTFGQDRERADELVTLLLEAQQRGVTIILATHDLQLAAAHADQVIVMASGRVAADGAVAATLLDDAVMTAAGLAVPALTRTLRGSMRHPELADVTRIEHIEVRVGV